MKYSIPFVVNLWYGLYLSRSAILKKDHTLSAGLRIDVTYLNLFVGHFLLTGMCFLYLSPSTAPSLFSMSNVVAIEVPAVFGRWMKQTSDSTKL